MRFVRCRPLPRLLVFVLLALSSTAFAATYLPISETELAARAPVIVRGTVVSKAVRLEKIDGVDRAFTLVTLQRLETIKGGTPETFSVRLPGGKIGDRAWWIPGTPEFTAGGEVVLLLSASGHPGEFHLSEFGLSKFDLVTDEAGRRFAVRPVFGAAEDLVVSARDTSAAAVAARAKGSIAARDAVSFLSALRAQARGDEVPEIVYGEPTGRFRRSTGTLRPHWSNIGGREPGDCGGGDPCLFRWYWETFVSPDAVVSFTGTQSNLNNDDPGDCGIDSNCHVQNAVDGWHDVADSDVHLSGPSPTGNIDVVLDATESFDGGSTWSTPLGCSGGIIGLAGPGSSSGPRTFKGDTTYYAPHGGDVSMRKVTCGSGYSAKTFKTALIHEVGHTLGLGHPDEEESTHSTTAPSEWTEAVMHSVVPSTKPDSPENDDRQAIQYLYGTGPAGTAPVANFTVSPAAPVSGAPVSFGDSSTAAPISWTWDFGDPVSGPSNTSTLQNPSHTFPAPGTYTVKLSAANGSGTGTISKSVTVAQGAAGCAPTATTLCLNNSRFQVSAAWRTSTGSTGQGASVQLTSDSGYFWFFNPANIEIVVKVLSGCGVNGHYWVFAAGLTNVEVTLLVTDTQTGTLNTYFNALNVAFLPVQDTSAFVTCP